MKPFFSIIIPVYNRPNEVRELLESLLLQHYEPYEVLIVEDGSSDPCKEVVDRYNDRLPIRYFTKPNSGRSDTRNYGMEQARGDYFLFFDSDCLLPTGYLEQAATEIERVDAACFGGPDREHPSFSPMQKAASFAMTSFFTTGGIRGNRRSMESFTPRTFNMGFSRQVYEAVGGFEDMFGEDIDLSKRIESAGFKPVLFPDLFVYHKRRVSLRSFFKQVYVFGMARIELYKRHPKSLKLVHLLPACFVLGLLVLAITSFWYPWMLTLPLLYALILFVEALFRFQSTAIACRAVVCSFIQLIGYGLGFLRASFRLFLLGEKDTDKTLLDKHYKGRRAS